MNRRDRISLAFCVLAVAISVFAIGGAPRWAQAVIAACVAIGVGVTARSKRRFDRMPPTLILLAFASAWTLLQLIPFPGAIARTLTATLDGLRADGTSLAGVPAATTLSMDPAATLRFLTFLCTLAGLGYLALRLAISERGRYLLLAGVAVTAGVAAVIAGIHELVGATKLYGVYEPRQLPPILGPLINPNHLGGLTAIGAVICGGLMLYQRQSTIRRVLWLGLGLGCIAVTTATYSRGAVIGLGAGLLVTIATLVAQRMFASDQGQERRRQRFMTTTLPIAVIVACSLFVTLYVGAGTVMSQLQATSLDELHAPRTKYAAWMSSLKLVKESPWVGTGRGAFESAFTRVHPASAYSTFSHPENELVQAIVEWGIPATIVLFGLASWVLVLALRRWRDGPLAAGALGALMVVAFQSNFDFGLELPGVAVPTLVLLATLTYVPLADLSTRRTKKALAARGALVIALLAGAALLLTSATRTLTTDHDQLRQHPTPQLVAASIEAHPLDYFGYSVLADQHAKAGDPDTVRVLNHALRLHPTHPGLHWIAARLLVRNGRLSQAEAEYSTVVRYSPRPKAVLGELVTVLPSERAASAIPLDEPLDTVMRYVRFDITARWLELVLQHRNDIRVAEALYSLGMRSKNWDMATRGARYRCRIMPSTKCSLELAKVEKLAGKPDEVIQTLGKVWDWQGRREDQLSAWIMLCDAYTALGKIDDAQDCKRRLDSSGLTKESR